MTANRGTGLVGSCPVVIKDPEGIPQAKDSPVNRHARAVLAVLLAAVLLAACSGTTESTDSRAPDDDATEERSTETH